MQMCDFVCILGCEHEMLVGTVTKHNAAVLIPASYTPPCLLAISSYLTLIQ